MTRAARYAAALGLVFGWGRWAGAEVKLLDTADYALTLASTSRTEMITLKNHIDLDSSQSGDTTTYFGLGYDVALGFTVKDEGPRAYLRFERNGPYDYDAPVVVHNTMRTSSGKLEGYEDGDLLPQMEEAWLDLPLARSPVRLKGGLFTYSVGHGISLGGAYENYGALLSAAHGPLTWRAYYCRPDVVNKVFLGPHLQQEEEQVVDYEHSKANFFSTDLSVSFGKLATVQLYGGALLDRTDTKRRNVFTTPTGRDTLGTIGFSTDVDVHDLSLGFEMARNVGEADSGDPSLKDVEHRGYMIYTSAGYTWRGWRPHSQFLLASGNKVTTEMADAGAATLTSGRNRAFSTYSPLNTTLADSIYPAIETVPIVAMGGGYGVNYGINRPTTFSDPRTIDNLIMIGAGLGWQPLAALSTSFDWWYLRTQEKGVGKFGGVSSTLPSDLGHELDLSVTYEVNEHLTLDVLSGYFFPGDYYEEERDDTAGSLFSPFIRGDGKTDRAYQIELIVTASF